MYLARLIRFRFEQCLSRYHRRNINVSRGSLTVRYIISLGFSSIISLTEKLHIFGPVTLSFDSCVNDQTKVKACYHIFNILNVGSSECYRWFQSSEDLIESKGPKSSGKWEGTLIKSCLYYVETASSVYPVKPKVCVIPHYSSLISI